MTLYAAEMYNVAKISYDKCEQNFNFCALIFMTKFVASVVKGSLEMRLVLKLGDAQIGTEVLRQMPNSMDRL